MCRHIALFSLVAVTLLVAGPASAQQETLRIGFVGYLLSGPNYDFGAVAGAQLAVDQINRAGGLAAPDGTTYRLELAIESAADEATARAAIQTLLDRGVIAILGPDAVEQTLPNLDLASDMGVPQLTSAMANAITAQAGSNYVFRIRASDRARSQALADYLVNQLGFQRFAVAFTDTIAGNAAAVAFDAALADLGAQPAVEARLASSDLDMVSDAQAIAANAPEVTVHWGNPLQAGELLRELRAFGWQGVFAYSDIDATFLGLRHRADIAGVLGPLTWDLTLPDPATRAFLADYVQAYRVNPNERSAAYYDAVQLLAAAIRAVGPEPSAIRDYLLNVPSFLAVQGELTPARFGNGETGENVVIVEIERDTLIPRAQARYRGAACIEGCLAPPAVVTAPTATPSETPADTPEPTLEPTATPTTEAAMQPTQTPTALEPTFTPTETETLAPTWTPSATLPAPVVTATATWTPVPLPNIPTATPTFPPTATATPTPGPSPTLSLTPTPAPVFVQTEEEVRMNMRSGPGLDYAVVTVLPANVTVEAVGRNADNTWLLIEYEDIEAWIAGWRVTVVEGDPDTLPILAPWGATATPGPTPAGVPIVAILYALDSEEAMDMVRLLLRLEAEYGKRVRFAYVNVDKINDFGLYNRIYGGTTPAIGFIDAANALRQVITGAITEEDLRARLETLAAP